MGVHDVMRTTIPLCMVQEFLQFAGRELCVLSHVTLTATLAFCRTMAISVSSEARRSILVDLLTVHALGGKAIVFTQTKREADEVAASLSLVHPCEVSCYTSVPQCHPEMHFFATCL